MGHIFNHTRYKRHYICFNCRKNFKQSNPKDRAEANGDLSLLLNAFYYAKPKKKVSKDIIAYLKTEYFEKTILCPECGKEMVEVNRSFKTPPKKDLKQWQAMYSFYKANGSLHEDIPTAKKELLSILTDSYQWHIHMLQHVSSHKKYLETVNQAKERLSTEMENIKAEITRLKSNQDYE